jgi:hypothetical protein
MTIIKAMVITKGETHATELGRRVVRPQTNH